MTLSRSSTIAVAVLALLQCAHAAKFTQWHQLEASGYNFQSFVSEYNKEFGAPGSAEYEMRRGIFEANLAAVHEHNKNGSRTWKQGVNHFTAHSDEEFSSMMGYIKMQAPEHSGKREFVSRVKPEDLPKHVDWREKGAVTPVKDQGMCGSCYAFATASTIEAHWYLKTGKLVELSEQQIASCVPNPLNCGGSGGCQGGTFELAVQNIVDQGGIMSEWSYGYVSYDGTDFPCELNTTRMRDYAAHVTGYVKLPQNQYWPLMEAVATIGPVAVAVDASAFRHYESGVFDGCNQENPEINHAVQLVGYGEDEQFGPYWLIRNSWTPNYGEGGYIRIRRDREPRCGVDTKPEMGTWCDPQPSEVTVCGTCAILYDTAYPIVEVPGAFPVLS